ncbi:hypothetical protein GCM10009865_06870 [Aeromicrobium ponti]
MFFSINNGSIVLCEDARIPNDMGFGNQPIAKIMHITTLEIPLVEIGRKLFFKQKILKKFP